ncbi:MAG: hypothetical protein DWQ34_19565 [Planctomycetota bacterium]|nr:MAG: hypothetical protein DWQ34_19565 [Planctomycetota bacterium]REK28973.1 MAG: hypothetical protein DWQ41_05355 [Planctomycetota bacterium]REK39593.1 MAG: hypothetical protein DWQ45_01590 [Planctomycetota bacterium]
MWDTNLPIIPLYRGPKASSTSATLLLLVIFICCVQACGQQVAAAESASITGTVKYTGEVPQLKFVDNGGVRRELLEVDRRSSGLRYAVVYLLGEFPEKGDSSADASDEEPVLIDQIDETFEPHVIAIRDGRDVRFRNSDGGNHNVRSATLEERNEFNVTTAAGGEYTHTLHMSRKYSPVRIGCDIHPWMSAWIYVFDHPYFAVTDELGNFEISGVPPGDYTLIIRQPDAGFSEKRETTVKAGEELNVEIEFSTDDVRD